MTNNYLIRKLASIKIRKTLENKMNASKKIQKSLLHYYICPKKKQIVTNN